MKKLDNKLLAILFIGLLLFSTESQLFQNGYSLSIPPTPAIPKIVTSNSTVQAMNYSTTVKFVSPDNSVHITGSNDSKTVFFTSMGAGGNTTGSGFGWWSVNTAPDLKRTDFRNFTAGPGLSSFVDANNFILSTNFNASSFSCPAGQVVTSYNNSTGVYTCTALSSGIQFLNGNNSSTQFINGTAGHILVTDIGHSHKIDTLFKINNYTCGPGQFAANYSNVTGITNCVGETNTVSALNVFPFRSLGTIYHNTSGQTMFVLVSAILTVFNKTDDASLAEYSGPTTPPTTFQEVGMQDLLGVNNTDIGIQFTLIVPNGYYYEVVDQSSGGATTALESWWEYVITGMGGSGVTLDTMENIGHGGVGFFAQNNTITNFQFKNLATDRTDLFLLTSNGTDNKLSSNFKADSKTCPGNSKFSAYNNSTGVYTCTGGSGERFTTFQNIGHGGFGFLTSSGTILQGKNLTGTNGNITISGNSTDNNVNLGWYAVVTNGLKQIFSKDLDFGQATKDTFSSGSLYIRNAASTFTYQILGGAILGNYSLSYPLITGSDTLAALNVKNNFTKQFNDTAGGQINGLSIARTVEKTTDYSITKLDDTVIMNVTAGTLSATLPTSNSTIAGKLILIKMVGFSAGNVVQVKPASGQTINGFTQYNMTHTDETFIVQSNGTSWKKLSVTNADSGSYQVRGSTRLWGGCVAICSMSGILLDVSSTIYAAGVIVSSPIQIDKLAVDVQAAANPISTNCRGAIYYDNGNRYPSSIVPGSDSGQITTNVKMHFWNYSTPITLQEGIYWKAISCATAGTTQPTFRANSGGTGQPSLLGVTNNAAANGQDGGMYRATGITYGAMPTTFPAGASVIATNTLSPLFMFFEITKG